MAFRPVEHPPVINCKEAAEARKIKLKQELKTILLNIDQRKIAVHIRGCDRVHFRSIKNLFRHENIEFLNTDELSRYNLKAGIINPWNITFCNYQLVCVKIFSNRFLATNNCTTTSGIYFLAKNILQLPNLIIGRFSHDKQAISI